MLIPNNDDFVEHIAKSIAKNRIHLDASEMVKEMTGIQMDDTDETEKTFNTVFDLIWSGTSEVDERNKSLYRSDAIAVIQALNLKLLTSEK